MWLYISRRFLLCIFNGFKLIKTHRFRQSKQLPPIYPGAYNNNITVVHIHTQTQCIPAYTYSPCNRARHTIIIRTFGAYRFCIIAVRYNNIIKIYFHSYSFRQIESVNHFGLTWHRIIKIYCSTH